MKKLNKNELEQLDSLVLETIEPSLFEDFNFNSKTKFEESKQYLIKLINNIQYQEFD